MRYMYMSMFLVFLGCFLLFYASPALGEVSYPYQDQEIGRFYAHFHESWEYVPDGAIDRWEYRRDFRGDCEDFAITFYGEGPTPLGGWIVVLPRHAVLVLQMDEDVWYLVDNGDLFLVRGTGYRDLYEVYPSVQRIIPLPSQEEVQRGEFSRPYY